jgi:hypothetical protein
MEQMTVKLSEERDLLVINLCKPYKGQKTVELPGGIVAGVNPTTGPLESLEILISESGAVQLDIPSSLSKSLKS